MTQVRWIRQWGRREPRRSAPLIGALALMGALILPVISGSATGYELGANLVNFGALISFMGVNAAAFVRYYLRAAEKHAADLVLPAVGFTVCLILWWNLSTRAHVFGLAWMSLGIAYAALTTRGFRRRLVVFEGAADRAE